MMYSKKWMAGAGIVALGAAVACIALCNADPPRPTRSPETVTRRVAEDAGAPSSDGAIDAAADSAHAPVATRAETAVFDAGPSCGSHPWCRVPLECCEADGSCCAS